MIDLPGGVFAPLNGLLDLSLLGPLRIFPGYPVQCSRGDGGEDCIWSVTSHECLIGLEARGVLWPGRCLQLCGGGWKRVLLRCKYLRILPGKTDAMAACCVQLVTRMIAWCHFRCEGAGVEEHMVLADMIKELLLPFSVGSVNAPGMAENLKTITENRERSRWKRPRFRFSSLTTPTSKCWPIRQ